MRFQDAALDARSVVYRHIQSDPLVARAAELLADATPQERLLARAAMNGERSDPAVWRAMFPGLFAEGRSAGQERAEAILDVALAVADRGEQARSQYRGAIVEAVTERLLARRSDAVRRERRVLFDGVRAEIHPYDVTVEAEGAAEAYDCKWGARGINADVLDQLDDARRSCLVRLARQTLRREGIGLVTIETLDRLAAVRTRAGGSPA